MCASLTSAPTKALSPFTGSTGSTLSDLRVATGTAEVANRDVVKYKLSVFIDLGDPFPRVIPARYLNENCTRQCEGKAGYMKRKAMGKDAHVCWWGSGRGWGY